MKHTILKAVVVIAILAQLTSCASSHKENRSPGHHRYRGAGRAW